MPDLPKYYSGLINIEAQSGANITLGDINHYTAQGNIKTYDFSHLIPSHDEFYPQDHADAGSPMYLDTLPLDHAPIKESFILSLDGMILSPKFALPEGSQDTADYRFLDDTTIEFLFDSGLRKQNAEDTPVLLARYARR